jgi:short-subunit dehydrogenase
MPPRYVQDGSMPKALVTGPTSGIGRAFAEAFAAHGLDLLLVSRDQQRLAAVAAQLTEQFGVTCEVHVTDLADRHALQALEEHIRSATDIVAVVNNAGFGLAQGFGSSRTDDEQALLDTLVTAVMRICHAVLPQMLERDFGLVINVSSVAGWIAGGTYSAAKSWVTVFTEGLANEVRDTGVRVVAVCPGFVRTEFHVRAGVEVDGMPEFMWLSSEQVVRQTFRDLALGTVVSVASPQYQVLATALQLTPRSVIRSVSRLKRRFVRGPASTR